MLHGFHDYRNINFRLHLQVEARLAHVALLVRAEGLLALERADVDFEAQLGHLFIERLSVPDRGLTPLGSHVVHVIVRRIRQLLHVLENYTHCLRVHNELAISLLLQRLGALEEIRCIDYQDALIASLFARLTN